MKRGRAGERADGVLADARPNDMVDGRADARVHGRADGATSPWNDAFNTIAIQCQNIM